MAKRSIYWVHFRLTKHFPGQDDASLRQTALGASVGVLGYRRARDTALPAAVASRLMARPKIQQMDVEMAKAGLMLEGCLLSHFDSRTEAALVDLETRLHTTERGQVRELAQKAQDRAQRSRRQMPPGRTPAPSQPRLQGRCMHEHRPPQP